MEVPVDELLEDYPELELEDVQAALMYATLCKFPFQYLRIRQKIEKYVLVRDMLQFSHETEHIFIR